jgi:hypothetical protein
MGMRLCDKHGGRDVAPTDADATWNAALDEAAQNCASATSIFDEDTCAFFAGLCRDLKRGQP